tara:strand:+ start:455 stop:679 length:225 start_codon:yes stop_codon:yes gene_type:complete
MQNLENVYSVLITNDNWDLKDDLMESFLSKEMIPVSSIIEGKEFESVKKQLKDSDNDILLSIIHLIKYEKNFEA